MATQKERLAAKRAAEIDGEPVEDAGVAPPVPAGLEGRAPAGATRINPGLMEQIAEPAEPAVRGVCSVFVFDNGDWRVQLDGMPTTEVPTLLRLVAKRVEAELGL